MVFVLVLDLMQINGTRVQWVCYPCCALMAILESSKILSKISIASVNLKYHFHANMRAQCASRVLVCMKHTNILTLRYRNENPWGSIFAACNQYLFINHEFNTGCQNTSSKLTQNKNHFDINKLNTDRYKQAMRLIWDVTLAAYPGNDSGSSGLPL